MRGYALSTTSPASHTKLSPFAAAIALCAILLAIAPRALAFAAGAPYGNCNSCHSGGSAPSVGLSADSTCILTGGSTIVHVTVSNANSGAQGFALALVSGGSGTLGTLGTLDLGGPDSMGTTIKASGVTQSSPKVGSPTRFSATYHAPDTATVAQLGVWGIATNSNGTATGDFAVNRSDLFVTVASPPACGALNCGSSPPNACGATVDCGGCTLPQTCGGGGTPKLCGCTKTTCPLAQNCGTAPDGCGGVIACGTCAATQACVSDRCEAIVVDGGDSSTDADSGAIDALNTSDAMGAMGAMGAMDAMDGNDAMGATDAAEGTDANNMAADSGVTAPAPDGGCACRVGAMPSTTLWSRGWSALILVAFTLARIRARRRTRL
ncbi:MAG: hypothetical protein NVSMB1_14130 [Polyangiales bacterium]